MNSKGIRNKKGWILPPEQIAKYAIIISKFEPHTDIEIRDKKVLEYLFLNGYTATKISEMNDPDIICFSNRKKGAGLSPTSILAIAYKYFPDLKDRPIKSSNSKNKRVELIKRRRKTPSKHIAQCAFCGSKENLEEHHMIPFFMGGDNSEENLVFLCKECHKRVSAYQKRLILNDKQ